MRIFQRFWCRQRQRFSLESVTQSCLDRGMANKLFKMFNSFEEAEAWDISYWNRRTPTARLRVAEKMRRQLYGRPPKEFPRVLKAAKRP